MDPTTPPPTTQPTVAPQSQLNNSVSHPPQLATVNYAPVGRRIVASLVDFIIWTILFMIAAQMFGESNTSYTTTTTTDEMVNVRHTGGATYQANLGGLPALLFFLAALLYYVFFEWLLGGSLGKLLLGLRVTNEQGAKLSFNNSLARNLMRIVDGFPYVIPNLVGLAVLASNEKKQRLGDKVAHTLVVKK